MAVAAWTGKPTYALEGSVFMGGATVQWLRDELKLINDAPPRASSSPRACRTAAGVFLVPAFTGLGAPYWDMYSPGHHRWA